jgi:RimJ/RimL family protein N-acetyltransferase
LSQAVAAGFDPRPATIAGPHVRLEPLARRHAAELFEAGRDESIWRYMPRPVPRAVGDVESMIDEALAEAGAGRQVPFAIIALQRGRAVGSTRYLDIRREHRGLEIGWTWLAAAAQRTAVNTECKYLLLRHAFEALGAIRVQLRTDLRNLRSQRAIERIGATREGVFRQERIMWDGYLRDSVFFSVLDGEWPAVKAKLEARLAAGGSGHP